MLAKINALLVRLFGDFTWAPPRWLVRCDHSATAWMHAHRRATFGVCLAVLVAVVGGGFAWEWYEHQPKPHTVTVDLEAPGLTVVKDNHEIIQPLSVKFGESVIPLSQSKATPVPLKESDPKHPRELYPPIPEGIRLDPPIPGTWRGAGERRLVFTPKSDWPAE